MYVVNFDKKIFGNKFIKVTSSVGEYILYNFKIPVLYKKDDFYYFSRTEKLEEVIERYDFLRRGVVEVGI